MKERHGSNVPAFDPLTRLIRFTSNLWPRLVLERPFDNDGLPLKRRVWIENGMKAWATRHLFTETPDPVQVRRVEGSQRSCSVVVPANAAVHADAPDFAVRRILERREARCW